MGVGDAIAKMIEDWWETAKQKGLPAGALRDQVPSAAIPPATSADKGGVILSDANPAATGTAAPGTSSAVSRTDHVHALSAHDHQGSTGDGGKLTNEAHDGYSVYEEIAAPSSPASNTARLYARDKSGVTELFYKNDAGTERDLSSSGGSGAPTTATYITQTPDAGLSAEQALSALATGIVKNTTGTGVLSIATGADLPGMVASGGSHSAGAVPDPGASAGTAKFLREDATWQTPSGTGAPTSAPYLTTAADATLSAEVVIPGLGGSPDRAGIGGGGITEEYDTGSSGLTWGTAPGVEDSNSTIPSHLYTLWTATVAESLGTRSWAPGSGAFDARAQIVLGNEQTSSFGVVGFHIGDSGNNNRLLINISATNIIAYSYAGSYTQRGSTMAIPQIFLPVYVRITRGVSNDISFYYSFHGLAWNLIGTHSFTFTVANIGYRINTSVSTGFTVIADWLRTSV